MALGKGEAACSKQALKKFQGKHVLLTGASGSLGRAFGLQLAHCGVRTLVLSGRNEIFLQHLADECREISTQFIEVFIVPCDLSDPADVVKLGTEASKLCTINVLINNAGVMIRDDFLETSPAVDQMLMQVNFLSGVALAKMLVPGMLERSSGTILWISSVQGFYSLPGCSTYAASKFAVQGYCEAMRAELAKTGVSVHVASPGFIRNKFTNAAKALDLSLHGKPVSTTIDKGALPDHVAANILTAVAKGKRDFLVAASMADRMSIWTRFLAPKVWNQHLVKVHDANIMLAAERAANDICVDDGIKDLSLDEDTQAESKDVGDVDTVSMLSHQSDPMKLNADSKDSDDVDLVVGEAPTEGLNLGTPPKDFKDDSKTADDDSVESIGSQLVRLAAAAGH